VEYLKKFGPIAVAILGMLTPLISTWVANFWASHGVAAAMVGSILAALAAFAPQPHK
jgi:hypothetical protein